MSSALQHRVVPAFLASRHIVAKAGLPVVSWETVREHIRSTLVLAIDEPERLGRSWEFPQGDGIQRQYVLPIVAFDRPHIQIISNVVPVDSLPAHEAMALNARIPIGGLCIADGFVLLRAVVPLEGVELAVIERALHDVAREAVHLRMQAVRKPSPAPYFE